MVRRMLLMALAVCLTGCLNVDETYHINPDGTGKVIHSSVLTELKLNPGQAEDTDRRAKRLVREELVKTKGVEVWADVSYSLLDDNRVLFKGTAYFTDIAEVSFHNGGTKVSIVNDLSLSAENGQMVLEIQSRKSEGDDVVAEAVPVERSEEEITDEIAKIRSQWAKMSLSMAAFMNDTKIVRRFRLPGRPVETVNMSVDSEGMVVNAFNGKKMLELMQKFMSDEEWLRRQVTQGKKPLQDPAMSDNEMNAFLFGETGPVRVTVETVETPLFDYQVEVAQAQAAYADMVAAFGMEIPLQAPAGGEFQVGGARWINYGDPDNDIRPFNYNEGYTLALVGTLPDKAIGIKSCTITLAQTGSGQDLLPEEEWDRKVHFPKLGKDGRAVTFELNLNFPARPDDTIELLEGSLVYLVSADSQPVELGISSLAAGAKGTLYGAEIVSIGDSQWSPGKSELQLKVLLPKDKIESVSVQDAAGEDLNVSESQMWTSEETTFHFTLQEGVFPSDGRIMMRVYDDVKEYEMPFRLSRLSLLGQPL